MTTDPAVLPIFDGNQLIGLLVEWQPAVSLVAIEVL